MKKLLTSLAVTAALAGASSANAFEMLDFVVDETSASPQVGAGPLTIGDPALVADEITGGYTELFTVTGPNTFITSAYWEASFFSKNEGTVEVEAGNNGGITPGLNLTYGMYGLFSATGTFALSGTGSTFTGADGMIEVYIDPNNDSVLSFAAGDTGADTADCANCGDDYLIAFSTTLLAGDGNLSGGLANGNFDLVFGDFTLTDPAGTNYFISPDPFHLVLDLSGQFIEFTPDATTEIGGSADAHFTVPEPATLALVGLGLLGAGAATRRRKA